MVEGHFRAFLGLALVSPHDLRAVAVDAVALFLSWVGAVVLDLKCVDFDLSNTVLSLPYLVFLSLVYE